VGDQLSRIEVHAGGKQVDRVLRQPARQRAGKGHVIRSPSGSQNIGERRDVVSRQPQRLDLGQFLLLMMLVVLFVRMMMGRTRSARHVGAQSVQRVV